MAETATLHAGCVVVAEKGLLILGPPGAGKSSLARDLVDSARRSGLFARLVSDDRTRLEAANGRLVARPVAPLEGLIEARGVGLLRTAFEAAAVIRLAVSLGAEEPPRLPEADDGTLHLCGVGIPRLFLRAGAPSCGLLLERLCGSDDAP